MLSVIVLAPQASDRAAGRTHEAVVRSLVSLVGAAVADIVRDACIVGTLEARLGSVADHAGCGLVESADIDKGLETAIRQARSDRVFVLAAGYAPLSGFIDEMSDWSLSASPPAAALRAEPVSLAQRIFPSLARCVGVVALKQDLLSVGGDSPAAMARKLGARALLTRARRVV